MSMEMEIGSLMAYVYSKYEAEVYTERMPQGFTLPALYFPPPIVLSTPFTSHSFQNDYSLVIKLFHEDEQGAFSEAERVANAIRKSRYCVPRRNEDGTPANRLIIVSEIDTRMVDSGSIVMGVAQITVNWKSRYVYDFPTYEKIMHVYGRFLGKEQEI